METQPKLPPRIEALYQEGLSLKKNILEFVDATSWSSHSEEEETQQRLLTELRRWINTLNMEVLPSTIYDKEYLLNIFAGVDRAFWHKRNGPPTQAASLAKEALDRGLSIVKSTPAITLTPSPVTQSGRQNHQPDYTPNTAFIMMAMNPAQPELDDVRNAIKEVCNDFAISAFRADDVEHQDKITDVVLQHIANSEFLIADLTGERPNVYYEIGYAHALNKRPILYRKKGTALHFDLSVHNVPEYKNITELKELLMRRFEAILGRKAKRD